jgi:uncharacterized membrane protein YozB (DUF420 family)
LALPRVHLFKRREVEMLRPGISESAAPWQADVTFLTETIMGIALLAGAFLARRRNYRAHAWCQSAVVLLNLVVIGLAMIPSFYFQVMPKIPRALRKPYYAIAAGHVALGVVAEVLGLYVLLAAGTHILPEKLIFKDYRVWMRTTLVLWWIVLLLGAATYLHWYVRL